ncbi:MAG: HAD family phosphatase [Alphaproteobacteria bacterium]|nr:HAD family phosphatase [Alphaproteobacteria bacterium]MBV8548495.1 HAD family phosphatase [Alphaproteobacteria bacterium]
MRFFIKGVYFIGIIMVDTQQFECCATSVGAVLLHEQFDPRDIVVAFDIDGTLIDSEEIGLQAMIRAAGVQVPVSVDEIRGKGMQAIHELFQSKGYTGSREIFEADYTAECMKIDYVARDGVIEALQLLNALGIRVVAVTNSGSPRARHKLGTAGILPYLTPCDGIPDGVLSPQDLQALDPHYLNDLMRREIFSPPEPIPAGGHWVLQSKPAPDAYMATAAITGAKLVITAEDSETGLQASREAQQQMSGLVQFFNMHWYDIAAGVPPQFDKSDMQVNATRGDEILNAVRACLKKFMQPTQPLPPACAMAPGQG